jgi:D-alanyl-D-alanine carboxypeptidase
MPVVVVLLLATLAAPGPGATTAPSPRSAEPIDREPVGAERTLDPGYVPGDLAEVPVPPATRPGIRLRAPARRALVEMVEAAHKDGVDLRVVSGYRSYAYQERLYDRAVAKYGADQQWVAVPGQSEHQLGTAVDLADAALQHVLDPSFAETDEGRWVTAHASEFGFTISYTEANAAAQGIRPEPWHVRYVGHPEDRSLEDH